MYLTQDASEQLLKDMAGEFLHSLVAMFISLCFTSLPENCQKHMSVHLYQCTFINMLKSTYRLELDAFTRLLKGCVPGERTDCSCLLFTGSTYRLELNMHV